MSTTQQPATTPGEDPMSTPSPSIPGVDRDALARAIPRDTVLSDRAAQRAANAAIAYIAARHDCSLSCGHSEVDIEMARAFNESEDYRKALAREICDREHDDEWVEVGMDDIRSLPMSVRTRQEWEKRFDGKSRLFVHRDDLPDDPRALIARELGPAKADTFLGLLDEHGWTVTRKGER